MDSFSCSFRYAQGEFSDMYVVYRNHFLPDSNQICDDFRERFESDHDLFAIVRE